MKQVQTIFCDDIRQEVGGKLTYVGAYSGSMLAEQFPIALPKFCIAVSLVVDAFPVDESVTICILRDAETLAEREVQARDLPGALNAAGSSDGTGSDRVQILTSFFVFSPLQIDTPCLLRVRVKIGDEELKGLGLGVAQLPASS